ncbi:MAG: hypothetical protein ACRDTA_15705 [Pseudonocardiaceae bacterium]
MSSGPSGTLTAYVDEAGGRLADGQWTYALGAVLLSADQHGASVATLRSLLLPARPFLRHYDETPARRTAIAGVLAQLPLHGAIVVTTVTDNTFQERARGRLLTYLLPRLEHMEHTGRVVLESRARSDKHDVRTRDRLRRSRSLSAGLHVDHENKTAEPMTWVADFVVSSYLAAQQHGEQGPWEIVSDAHVIDIVTK